MSRPSGIGKVLSRLATERNELERQVEHLTDAIRQAIVHLDRDHGPNPFGDPNALVRECAHCAVRWPCLPACVAEDLRNALG